LRKATETNLHQARSNDMQRPTPSLTYQGTQRMVAEYVVIRKEHEGIGNALRSAYRPQAVDMPVEFWELLDKLD
jgi:uncharacterized NAD(P)/FAD-binding protein YdhS